MEDYNTLKENVIVMMELIKALINAEIIQKNQVVKYKHVILWLVLLHLP